MKRREPLKHNAFLQESISRDTMSLSLFNFPSKVPHYYCETVKNLNQISENLKTKSFAYFIKKSHCHFFSGLFSQSLFYAKYVLTNSTSNHEKSSALNLLGVIYSTNKRYSEAFNFFMEGKKIDPNSPTINYNLALMDVNFKNYQRALDRLKPLLKSQDPFVTFLSAHCMIMNKDFHKAKILIEKLPPKDFKSKIVLLHYAFILFKENKLEKAEKMLSTNLPERNDPLFMNYSRLLKFISDKEN